MKRNLFLIFVVMLLATACGKGPKSPFTRKVSDYALVTIPAPNLNGITDNGKEVLNLYRFAADEIDAIYWKQYFGDKNALLGGIDDPKQKEFATINYGPWDRVDGRSFVEGYDDRLPGAGFYPADMTPEEFEALEDSAKFSPYTLIRRDEDGSLKVVWYHDAYKDHIDKIANYLSAAADITIKPSVKEYLLRKAEALKKDEYYESGKAWLEMEDSKMDLVIGPNEAADDQLLGIKRSYEAFVLLKNEARTEQLMKYASRLEEFQRMLPVEDMYKSFQPGAGSDIFSCDAIYYAGKANAGIKVIALNLPYDADIQKDKGTRTILLENVIRQKLNYVISPTGDILLDQAAKAHLSQDAFFWNIVFREVAHGLGVKETINGKGTVEEALGSSALTFEEMKGNAVGMYLVCKLQNHIAMDRLFTTEDALATFFTSLVRSERFGEGSALGRANTMVFNYLKEKEAFDRHPDGRYSINYEKMEAALGQLSALILRTQATGDIEYAMSFEDKYSHRDSDFQADLMNLSLEKVPMDIRFKFKK